MGTVDCLWQRITHGRRNPAAAINRLLAYRAYSLAQLLVTPPVFKSMGAWYGSPGLQKGALPTLLPLCCLPVHSCPSQLKWYPAWLLLQVQPEA